jgi:peroxiredoxin
MKTRRTAMTMVTLLALAAITISAPAQNSAPSSQQTSEPKVAKVGEAAPDFTLKDVDGKEHRLSDHKGKIVVLQWINPGCPVCRRCAETGVVASMGAELKKMDASTVHLAINSTHTAEPKDGADYLTKHKISAPALSDKDGTVGRLYGAKTTPHMFVIDAKGILRYSGAIDDDPRGRNGDEATNYVVNAVSQILADKAVSPDTTRPYGCSVKYSSAGGKGQGRGGAGRGRDMGKSNAGK